MKPRKAKSAKRKPYQGKDRFYTPRGPASFARVAAAHAGQAAIPGPYSGTAVAGEPEAVRHCCVCGCTDERACPGGCSWAGRDAYGRDYCTRCANPSRHGLLLLTVPAGAKVCAKPAFPCTEKRIVAVCDLLAKHLIGKHRSYGETALYPIQIFGRGHAVEGLQVRIDDKLSRIKNNPSAYDEDAVLDLMGYLVLLRLAKEDEKHSSEG